MIMETNNGTSTREDLVDTAIKFLVNPKVLPSPLSQKQIFLRKQGLTDDEIRDACERSGAYTLHEMQIASPEMPPPFPPEMIGSYGEYGRMQLSLFERIRDIVYSYAVFSVVAHLIKKIYNTYIAPFLFGTKRKSLRDKMENLEDNVEDSFKDLQSSLGKVNAELDKINFNTVTELKNIKSDVATVKKILFTRNQFSTVTNSVLPPSIPAWQLASVHEERKEELLEVGSGSSEEHFTDTSGSSLEIINREDTVEARSNNDFV